MNEFGRALRLTLFGTSRGRALGCALSGLPAGLPLDLAAINGELDRRRPLGAYATPRREADRFELLSGLYRGKCDGTPLVAVFYNEDTDKEAYPAFRPSHADYAACLKYGGYNDPRGGGMFSGRMTLPLVFAGAAARQLLSGVCVAAHILSIGGVSDAAFDPASVGEKDLAALDPFFPLLDPDVRAPMLAALEEARAAGDSLGCAAECAATGLPAGLGEPFFDSLESTVSHLLFSIPGVKGVEFGDGFRFAAARGSAANDPFSFENPFSFEKEKGKKKAFRSPCDSEEACDPAALLPPVYPSHSNHAGGVNGGISNGQPLILRAAFRPIPTLALPQEGLTPEGMPYTASFLGRNDICILPRAAVAVEAAVCLALADAWLLQGQHRF